MSIQIGNRHLRAIIASSCESEIAMAGAVKKSKIEEVAEGIDMMAVQLKRGVPFNLFAWKQLYRKVEQLEHSPDVYGAALLNQAVMWGFRGCLPEIKKRFDRYAGEIGKDWNWYLIMANMAPKLGDISGVKGLLASDFSWNDKFKVAKVVEVCGQTGFFVSARKAMQRLAELDSGMAEKARTKTIQHISVAAEYFLENNISEEKVAERLVFASRSVVELGYVLSSYAVTANESGVIVEFAVIAEIDKIIDLDFAITERLVSKFDDVMSQHVSFGVLPMELG